MAKKNKLYRFKNKPPMPGSKDPVVWPEGHTRNSGAIAASGGSGSSGSAGGAGGSGGALFMYVRGDLTVRAGGTLDINNFGSGTHYIDGNLTVNRNGAFISGGAGGVGPIQAQRINL